MKRELSQSFKIAESKIAVSYNGFDEEDFSEIPTNLKLPIEGNNSQERVINIGYIGNMYKHTEQLNIFYKALKELIDSEEIANNLIRLKFMGNYYKEEREIIENSGLSEIIKITPQQEHNIAVKEMLNNDILLLLIGTKSGKNVLNR